MKLKQEANDLPLYELNDYTTARCKGATSGKVGFQKLMVFYKYGKPVWAHKDLILPRKIRKKSKKRG